MANSFSPRPQTWKGDGGNDEFIATAEPLATTIEMLSVMPRRLLYWGFRIALVTTATQIVSNRVWGDDSGVERHLHCLFRFHMPCFVFQYDASAPSSETDRRVEDVDWRLLRSSRRELASTVGGVEIRMVPGNSAGGRCLKSRSSDWLQSVGGFDF